MPNEVIVCNGCCCGNTKKGHPEVPIKFLSEEWEKHGLDDIIKLRISRCLGPCSMHNVSILRSDNGLNWIGNLSEEFHYRAIVDWAIDVSKNESDIGVPEILIPHLFERFEEVLIRDNPGIDYH